MVCMTIPDGYHTATPYMMYRDAAGALEFVKKAFGAVERMCEKDDAGRIRHAEFTIGDSAFMLSQETPRFEGLRSIEAFGGSAVQIFLYMDDVDAVVERAVAAGGKIFHPIADQTYGRSGGVLDPFGLVWWITTPPKK
jgi:PhnB protein